MIDAHNALQVDFACLGNHEFDFGIEAFLNVSEASKFPWLNANAYEIATGKLLRGTQPNAVKTFDSPTMGKIKVGAFGVMYDMNDSSKGMRWTNPIEAAKEQVTYLRDVENVDLVIALTHQFWQDDNRFAQEVKGINIIYGGHDHSAMLQSNFGPTYIKSDLDFRSIWISDIKYYSPKMDATNVTKPAFTKMHHKNLAITQGMNTDYELDTIIAGWEAKMSDLSKKVVGSLCGPTDLTKLLVRYRESPIGNFFADAFRAFYTKVKVDASVMNGGGIRTDKIWPAQEINFGDVLSWSPFGNAVLVVSTDGASLKKFINSVMLQSCGNNMVAENGLYLHVSGFKYTFTCTGPLMGVVTELQWAADRTQEPIKDSDTLYLAISDFMYDSFVKVGVSTVVISKNEAWRTEAILEQYIYTLPSRSVCPKNEGRNKVVFV
jgi:2',3'-cyclic-nucleotide 2'-phosphodiesterase (5'-nucleotidase family)